MTNSLPVLVYSLRNTAVLTQKHAAKLYAEAKTAEQQEDACDYYHTVVQTRLSQYELAVEAMEEFQRLRANKTQTTSNVSDVETLRDLALELDDHGPWHANVYEEDELANVTVEYTKDIDGPSYISIGSGPLIARYIATVHPKLVREVCDENLRLRAYTEFTVSWYDFADTERYEIVCDRTEQKELETQFKIGVLIRMFFDTVRTCEMQSLRKRSESQA